MKKWIGILVLVVFAFMLVGWDSGSKEIRGNQFDTGKVSKIVKGKTTGKRYTLTIYFFEDVVKNFNYEEEDITTKGGSGGM